MNRSQAIIKLFNLQSTEEKLEIIKANDLRFSGFSAITKQILEQKPEFINAKLTSNFNLKEISKNVNKRLKFEKGNMDYLLAAERIIEKYSSNWMSLLIIFEKDNYQDKTEEILRRLESSKINRNEIVLQTKKKEKVKPEGGEDTDEIIKLRKIIIELEKELKNKNQKINTYIKENNEYSNELNRLKENLEKTSKVTNEYSVKSTELEKENVELNNINNRLEQEVIENRNTLNNYENQLNSLTVNIEAYREKMPKIIMIGLPMVYRIKLLTKDLNIINDNELTEFITDLKQNPIDDIVVYKLGVSNYNLYLLKEKTEVLEINNLDELEAFIEEKVI